MIKLLRINDLKFPVEGTYAGFYKNIPCLFKIENSVPVSMKMWDVTNTKFNLGLVEIIVYV